MAARRFSIGAELTDTGDCHFRLWAPKAKQLELVLQRKNRDASTHAMTAERDGYYSLVVPDTPAGSTYQYRVNRDDHLYPDPASRFQPEGPHGPSQVIDPRSFRWTDTTWHGVAAQGQVLYEMHIGTFTPAGTWQAARAELPRLVELGITVLEVMPVADFPGRFGWGYDGVDLFAPTRLYGTPDDFRAFVDAAHALNLGVILDVVYNHFGPTGNYLRQFADEYFSTRYKNDWGDPINFDDANAGPVRAFYLDNVAYWIEEFHVDGFRLDATQQIFDASPKHILRELMERIRATAPERQKFVVAENEQQEARLVRALTDGGHGLDALCNDDFHHSARVALTGRNNAYYHDHLGQPQEFISAAKWGFLFQGQRYAWQKARRGHPALDLEPANFVTFLENHDQVANSARGQRLHQMTSPGRLRALTALLLLGPQTPMLFQGQEFGATNPFVYFADQPDEIGKLVCKGRREFLGQFANLKAFAMLDQVPDPGDADTFARCKLNAAEARPDLVALHRDLVHLRRSDAAFHASKRRDVDGAVLGPDGFVLRFFAPTGDRLLLVNLGRDIVLPIVPEPLLAPPEGMAWSMLWSSEAAAYGGIGHVALESDEQWRIPGEAAVVLAPTKEATHE